jgi:hypothetical protein
MDLPGTLSPLTENPLSASLLAMADQYSTLISTDSPLSSDRRPEQAHSPRCRQCLVTSKLPRDYPAAPGHFPYIKFRTGALFRWVADPYSQTVAQKATGFGDLITESPHQ